LKALRHYFSRWENIVGLFFVAAFVIVAVAAPLLSPDDPTRPGPFKVVGRANDFEPRPPGPEAPLGTLPRQVSVYHALVWGARSALVFGVTVATITALIGTLTGAVSAYFGGFTGRLLMGITDAFLSFPVIAGVVLIQQLATIALYNFGIRYYTGGVIGYVTGSGGYTELPKNLPFLMVVLQRIDPVLLAFILFSWMIYARMMHIVVLRVKQAEYVQAARALGASHTTIIFRHLIPNAIAPVVVLAARDVGGMVLLRATFTFIGLGGSSIWGTMLVNGRDWIITPGGIFTYWWVFLPTALALIFFGIGWNLLGDGLNDVLNPRLR
jgi:peptide/nickel transport system permease protein